MGFKYLHALVQVKIETGNPWKPMETHGNPWKPSYFMGIQWEYSGDVIWLNYYDLTSRRPWNKVSQ